MGNRVRTCAWYVSEAKRLLGDARMSDRELGERLGYIQSNIARAKAGYMTDPIAIAIAKAIGTDPGEVLLVARAEREKDSATRAHLLAYAKKALASVPSRVAGAVGTLAMALGMAFSPVHDAQAAAAGGSGEIRTHGWVPPSLVFKTSALNRSATLPWEGRIVVVAPRGRRTLGRVRTHLGDRGSGQTLHRCRACRNAPAAQRVVDAAGTRLARRGSNATTGTDP